MLLHLLRNLAIASLLFVASGCLLTTSNTVQESGTRVGGNTLHQVELGKTSESWLVSAIGQPSSRSRVHTPGTVEIIGYSHEVEKRSRGSFFLLFNGKSQQTDRTTTFFEITDGVITRYWTET